MAELFLVAVFMIGIWWIVRQVFRLIGRGAIAAEDAVRNAARRPQESTYDAAYRRRRDELLDAVAHRNGERDAADELRPYLP